MLPWEFFRGGPNFAATARDLLACLATETYVENVHLELAGIVGGDAQALLLWRLHRRHQSIVRQTYIFA